MRIKQTLCNIAVKMWKTCINFTWRFIKPKKGYTTEQITTVSLRNNIYEVATPQGRLYFSVEVIRSMSNQQRTLLRELLRSCTS